MLINFFAHYCNKLSEEADVSAKDSAMDKTGESLGKYPLKKVVSKTMLNNGICHYYNKLSEEAYFWPR